MKVGCGNLSFRLRLLHPVLTFFLVKIYHLSGWDKGREVKKRHIVSIGRQFTIFQEKELFNAKIDIHCPIDCSDSDIYAFICLVKEGGEVDNKGLPGRVRRAVVLGFFRIDNKIASVAAIKSPNHTRKREVFKSAGSRENPDYYNVELGWIVTKEQHRGKGLASTLVSELLKNVSSPIFATTREDNKASLHILEKYGFKRSGHVYPGRRCPMALYLRNMKTPASDLGA
jgi:ribosomal protein S18 acetylase RimI-like enzyme